MTDLDTEPYDTAPDPFDTEGQILYELHRLRVRQEAQRRLDDENREPVALPSIKGLDVLLAEPDTPTPFLIEGVASAGSRNLLSAQYKAGKTTLLGNLTRSLVDGEPFLGHFGVQAGQRVALFDNELNENTMRRWLRDQRIQNAAAVSVVTMRGRVGTFNLLDDRCRTQWATRLADLGTSYLMLDCLRPVLDALGLDENRDAGRFLVAFDALLQEAGIADALVVHHMGHAGERSRGDSRLQDWPDAIWRLVREDDEPGSPRYFTAFGRDVDVHEGRLNFDPVTRRLTYAAGSRSDIRVEAAVVAVLERLAEDAATGGRGLSGRAVESDLVDAGHPRQASRDAIKHTVRQGTVVVEKGPRGARIHRIANPCDGCGMPVTGPGSHHQSCASGSAE